MAAPWKSSCTWFEDAPDVEQLLAAPEMSEMASQDDSELFSAAEEITS